MADWKKNSTAQQLAGYLRGELERGRWKGRMPGVIRLAKELGVARNSVEEALRDLEKQGLLHSQGAGKGRVIDLRAARPTPGQFCVGILMYEDSDRFAVDTVQLLRDLEEAGHLVRFGRS